MTGAILVTGANGTIGSEVVRLLAADGCAVRGLVRGAEKAAVIASSGGDPVIGAFEDPESLDTAMRGVDTVVLITAANPDAARQARQALEAARQQGVRRIVRISALKADADGPTANTRLHAETEQDLARSGISHVVLRPNLFMQNLLLAAPTIAGDSAFYFGMSGARMGMVDTRDVARCAAACARSDGFDGQAVELTGPASIGYGDVAAIMSEVLGRRIAYVAVSPNDVFASIAGSGWGEWLAGTLRDYAAAYRSGWGDFTSDGVQRITGQAPRPVEAFIREVLVPAL